MNKLIGSSPWLLIAGMALSASAAGRPPHLDQAGREAFRQFQSAEAHRAFAISPGGRWGWSASAPSPEYAIQQALAYCQERNEQRCVPHSVDGVKVFDAKSWVGLWGPYADARAAARAQIGLKRGMRFPDLALVDEKGRNVRLSALRGHVVVLHFWGSWCGVCRGEMPEIGAVARKLDGSTRFALIQVREGVDQARAWLRRQGLRLPLYDSGARGASDELLRLADGGTLHDREIAKAFPSTYVLDRHGIVLFSRTGPIKGWSEYVSLMQHAALNSK
jgi:thiol-disulfide isomerase/thioredoxin